jgi:hypothetical protein
MSFLRDLLRRLFGLKKKPAVVVPPPVVLPPLPPVPDVVPEDRVRLGVVAHHLNRGILDRLAAMGVERVRYPVFWNRWLTDPAYRNVVLQDVNCGLDVLVVCCGQNELPSDLSSFIEMVRDIHAMNVLNPLQIWNEVDHIQGPGNGWQFFGGEPEPYCAHLEEVRRAVPNAYLVSTGLATGENNLARWVTALHRSTVNAIAAHSYGPPPGPNYFAKADLMRALTNKPLWNTEFGTPTSWILHGVVHYPDQVQDLVECSPFTAYRRSYAFRMDVGDGDPYGFTPTTEAWIGRWNRSATR